MQWIALILDSIPELCNSLCSQKNELGSKPGPKSAVGDDRGSVVAPTFKAVTTANNEAQSGGTDWSQLGSTGTRMRLASPSLIAVSNASTVHCFAFANHHDITGGNRQARKVI